MRHNNNVWATEAEVELAAGRAFTYKFVQCDAEGRAVRWQSGADSILTIRNGETALEVRALAFTLGADIR